MQPQHPPTYEEVSSDDQAGKMPDRPAESSPVDQATGHVLPQYSREYIQYLREKEHRDHQYRLSFLRHAQMSIFFFSMIMIFFPLAYNDLSLQLIEV